MNTQQPHLEPKIPTTPDTCTIVDGIEQDMYRLYQLGNVWRNDLLQRIEFEFDSSRITDDVKTELRRRAHAVGLGIMFTYASPTICVVGVYNN